MPEALKWAKKGIKHKQTPFGACIVKNGRIIASAHNLVYKNNDPTAHAEISAIKKACKKLGTIDLKDYEIYSTTEPCPMCFSAIHWARISKIVFGTTINDVKGLGFSELNISNKTMKKISKEKIKIKEGFMRNECLEILKLWKKSKNNHPY